MADEVPFDVLRKLLMLCAELLGCALAKNPLPTGVSLRDGLGRVRFRNGHQLSRVGGEFGA
jgi:hypothetical protein